MYFFILLLIGLANALPLPLTGSVLSVRLSEAGFDREAIGLFALLWIPFSLKLLWFPLVDQYRLPFFGENRRKGWICFALAGMSGCLFTMSSLDAANSPYLLAACSLLLSCFTGCFYVTGISYELESIPKEKYTMGTACVNSGYRLGLLLGGSGALYFSFLWDWSAAYSIFGAILAAAGLLILLQPEPYKSHETFASREEERAKHGSGFQFFWREMVIAPFKAFLSHRDCLVLLVLLLVFKTGDQLNQSMSAPFYLSLGFNKADLATIYKLWGLGNTIFGAFFAAFFLKHRNHLLLTATMGLVHTMTLLFNPILAETGKSYELLSAAIAVESFTGGAAMALFISLLWKTCDKRYAPVQYALLWSLYSFKSHLFSCLGGAIAEQVSWTIFFQITLLAGLISLAGAIAFITYRQARSPASQIN